MLTLFYWISLFPLLSFYAQEIHVLGMTAQAIALKVNKVAVSPDILVMIADNIKKGRSQHAVDKVESSYLL